MSVWRRMGKHMPTDKNTVALYYAQLFPHEAFCDLFGREWRGGRIALREIALETTDGCYIRYLNTSNASGIKKLLADKHAEKIHVGAIYNVEPPLKRKKVLLVAMQRELVFDIDLNDYVSGVDADDIEECDAMWHLVAFGAVVIRFILKEHFAFEHIMISYSGRRGCHITVHDARACGLEDEARSAILNYLQPLAAKGGKRPNYGNMLTADFFERLFASHVEPFWESFGIKCREDGGMGVFDTVHQRNSFMELLGISHISAHMKRCNLPTEFWAEVQRMVSLSKYHESSTKALRETMMTYMWPRLDAGVTKHLNHLNKSVYSLHPKTGRISVPVGKDPFKFNPKECPTLQGLVAGVDGEITAFKASIAWIKHFTNKVKASSTESWEKPAVSSLPPPVHSLVSKKRDRKEREAPDNKWMYTSNSRLVYLLNRTFYLLSSSAQPESVSVYFRTSTHTARVRDSVVRIYGGYSPPFRGGSEMFDALEIAEKAAECAKSPETQFVLKTLFVCALLDHTRNDIDREVAQLAAMASRFDECHVYVGTVNLAWKGGAVASALTQMVQDVWENVYIYM